MTSQVLDHTRAVEIVSPSYGSAYRIGGRLVLTSSHLLEIQNGKSKECGVRLEQSQEIVEATANVVWRAPRGIDVALIELPGEIDAYAPVVFGKLNNDRKYRFKFYGWPEWARTIPQKQGLPEKAVRKQIEGLIYPGDDSPDKCISLQPDSERSPSEFQIQRVPQGKSPWDGASGAAIICNNSVVGVQRQHQRPDRPGSLEAEPLCKIYHDPEWQSLLEKHDIDPNPVDLGRANKDKPTHQHQKSRFEDDDSWSVSQSIKRSEEKCRIVGNPPQGIDSTFKDRREELEDITKLLVTEESDIRSIIIYGKGGIGKTALACKIMAEIKKNNDAFGLVYLSTRLGLGISLEQIYLSSAQGLENEDKQMLKSKWVDRDVDTFDKIQTLLSCFKDKRFIFLLDNLEDKLCKKTGNIEDPDLALFVDAFMRQSHNSLLLITSRELISLSNDLWRYQKSIFLEKGLPLSDALEFLEECDQDNLLGLEVTNSEILKATVKKTYGYPRALEAIIGILYNDPFITLEDLLNNEYLFGKEVINELVGEALSRLSNQEYRVMQVLAVYRRPVGIDAVYFILKSFEEETAIHELLKQLARSRYITVDRQTKKISLHPMDNDSIYASILDSDSFNKQYLESHIADYYFEHRTPRETWKNIADLEPQLFEFEHRCKAYEYNQAAEILSEIDDTLLLWGVYRRVVEQHTKLLNKISDPKLELSHLFSLGRGYRNLGYYVESIDCCNQALSIAEKHKERGFIGAILGNLGTCYTSLGRTDEAIHYYRQALELIYKANLKEARRFSMRRIKEL